MTMCKRQHIRTQPASKHPVIYNGIDINFTETRKNTIGHPHAPGGEVLAFIRYRCNRCGWVFRNRYLYYSGGYDPQRYYEPPLSEVQRRLTYHSDRCRVEGNGKRGKSAKGKGLHADST